MSVMVLPREMSTPRPISEFNTLAEAVAKIVPCDELILLTTMPRGGLQVCRTILSGEPAVKRYGEWQGNDRVSWQAIRNGQHVPAADERPVGSPLGIGLTPSIAVRIEGPVFEGLPGVLIALHRSDMQFDPVDGPSAAAEIRSAYDAHMRGGESAPGTPRQFIFSGSTALLPNASLSELDAKLAQSVEHQLPLLESKGGEGNASAQYSLPDSTGNCWPVSFVRYASYPVLSDGPVTFVSLHPRTRDWEKLDSAMFSADPEVSRLAQAVSFMVKHYRRGPTLEEVAASVHLSQFHFHRRFSDVFGLTPKELLYDLQIDEAKRLLSDPRQALADIARHCGFSHQSHFTSRFKQGTGLTPTRWRRVTVSSGRA